MLTVKKFETDSEFTRRSWTFELIDSRIILIEYREESRSPDKPHGLFKIDRIWRNRSRVYCGTRLETPVMPTAKMVREARQRIASQLTYHGVDYRGAEIDIRFDSCKPAR